MMKDFLSAILVVFLLITILPDMTMAQDSSSDLCGDSRIVFGEYVPDAASTRIQCLHPNGELETLLENADSGEVSPNWRYLAYIVIDETQSLYLYDLQTTATEPIVLNKSHIAANWLDNDQLVVSTWEQKIATSNDAFTPDARFLFDPVTGDRSALNWPTGNGIRLVDYWQQEDAMLLANYSDGLFGLTHDDTRIQFELPYEPANSRFELSSDDQFVVYSTDCENADSLQAACVVIFNLKTGHAQLIDDFADDYWAISRIELSASNQYAAFRLNHGQLLIYDLVGQEVIFENVETNIIGFKWLPDSDFILLTYDIDENDSAGYSQLFLLNVDSGEMEQLTDEPVWWVGFY